MIQTIIGARTFTRKKYGYFIIAAMIATMIEPAFPDALIIV